MLLPDRRPTSMNSYSSKSRVGANDAGSQRGRKPGATSISSGGAPSQYCSYSSGGKSVLSQSLYDDARSIFSSNAISSSTVVPLQSCPVDRSSYSIISTVRSDQSVATSVASSIDRRSISSSSAISSSSGWKFNFGFDPVRWFYFDFEIQKRVKRRWRNGHVRPPTKFTEDNNKRA